MLSALAFDLGLFRRSRGEERELSLRSGCRLLLSDVIEVPTGASLAVIAAALTLAVVASLKWPAVQPVNQP